MEFAFSVEQEALRALAKKALAAREPWSELGRAGLLGVAIPEAYGGAGLGLVELCLLCEEAGRAAVSLVPSLLGALALAEFGGALRDRWLPEVARGEVCLALAPLDGATRSRRADARLLLDGVIDRVEPAAAARVVVAARLDGEPALLLVDPCAGGREPQQASDGAALERLTLDGAPVELLAAGRAALEWLAARRAAALCATALGIAERQLAMTAEHVVKRHQFGKPIGAFQAVAQRIADAYIDVDAMRLTAWQAAWRLSAGLPADDELAIARFWAAEAGARVSATAQHLHGGLGFDRAYPLHRYFLVGKRVELELGAAASLAELGARLARHD
jgi:acyl-CoA dehydrogenase